MKKWLLMAGLVALWFSLFVPVAAQEEEIPYWGYQWGFPYEVDSSWEPQFVKPVQARELWGTPGGPTAQPVFMGYPSEDGHGFREVEFLGFQDRIMWIQGPPRFYDDWASVVVSAPMWDHQGKVQFVVLNYWRDYNDEPWQGSWKTEEPPSHLILCYVQVRCPKCWPLCPIS